MRDKLIKVLDDAVKINTELAKVYEEVMIEAIRRDDNDVYDYYEALYIDLTNTLLYIEDELHKLKEE